MNDLKFAIRQVFKNPLTSAAIVLTIAILTGGASVIYASLLDQQARLAPFPDPDRVVKLWRTSDRSVNDLFPGDLFLNYEESLDSFTALGATSWDGLSHTLTGVGEPKAYFSLNVSRGMFGVIGLQPVAGRFFSEGDELERNGKTVIISEALWNEKFGGEASAIGENIKLNEEDFTIIGVMPDAMRRTHIAPGGIDLWRPGRIGLTENDAVHLSVYGRLKPGVAHRAAQAELDALGPRLEQAHSPGRNERAIWPDGFGGARLAAMGVALGSQAESLAAARVTVFIFGGVIVASVMGIAVFSVTNLLLARSTSRSREMAIRLALGARQLRIAWLLLLESLLMAMTGGGLGLVVSLWLRNALRVQSIEARFDPQLFLLTLGGACLLGTFASLAPALRSARTDLNEALKDGTQSSSGVSRHRLRNFFVASQVAMALILSVTAGLFGRSFFNIILRDPGFDPERLVSVTVDPRRDAYAEADDRAAYAGRCLEMLQGMPGVDGAGILNGPGSFNWRIRDKVYLAGEQEPSRDLPMVAVHSVSGEYPDILGMTLLRGRSFSENAGAATGEVLVSEQFAAQFFPEIDPIGQVIRIGNDANRMAVVGVLKNRAPLTAVRGVSPEVFFDYRHRRHQNAYTFLVRTKTSAALMAERIRDRIRALDRNQPVQSAILISEQLRKTMREPRTTTVLFGSMAGFGLLLALMGVYGVVANSVIERTRELGIRMAIGAGRRNIINLLLREGLRLMLLGGVPGLIIVVSILNMLPKGRGLAGLNPAEPVPYIVVLILIGAAGFAAALFPARRAASIDPMEALRYE